MGSMGSFYEYISYLPLWMRTHSRLALCDKNGFSFSCQQNDVRF